MTIDPNCLVKLARIVDRPHCLVAREDLICYGYDATPAFDPLGLPNPGKIFTDQIKPPHAL